MELHFDHDYFKSGDHYFYCLSISCPLLASFEVFSNPVDMLVSFYETFKRLARRKGRNIKKLNKRIIVRKRLEGYINAYIK